MEPREFLAILARGAKLKTNTRHCYTEENRKESVADHSWRTALMAMLLDGIPEFDSVDMDKVIRMCLIHDLGEAFTGDIPTFEKSDEDAAVEDRLFDEWVDGFPEKQRDAWKLLLSEMGKQETREAKLYKALDKIEALISHNESDLSTWLPLEYDLQLTYGKKEMEFSPYLKSLREAVDTWTKDKIQGRREEDVREKENETNGSHL